MTWSMLHHAGGVCVPLAARVDPSDWGWPEILYRVFWYSAPVWFTLAFIIGIWAMQRLAQSVLGGSDDEPIDYDRL